MFIEIEGIQYVLHHDSFTHTNRHQQVVMYSGAATAGPIILLEDIDKRQNFDESNDGNQLCR
jgi:hypothetical protein